MIHNKIQSILQKQSNELDKNQNQKNSIKVKNLNQPIKREANLTYKYFD